MTTKDCYDGSWAFGTGFSIGSFPSCQVAASSRGLDYAGVPNGFARVPWSQNFLKLHAKLEVIDE